MDKMTVVVDEGRIVTGEEIEKSLVNIGYWAGKVAKVVIREEAEKSTTHTYTLASSGQPNHWKRDKDFIRWMEECVKLSGGKSIWNRMFDHTDNRLLKDFLKSLDPRQQDDWLVRNSAIEKPCLVEVKEYDPELVSLGCTILDYKEVNSNG